MLEVSGHVRDEEGRLFPLLTAAGIPEALDELGDKVRIEKRMAPTCLHPSGIELRFVCPAVQAGSPAVRCGRGMDLPRVS